ncbi:2-dehydropantoate 2-reductase [Opitutaceae bacterium EW11]|nr:2-dehydropantoate 2-reductase [Opitutaceae bacterium EW11]
MAFSKIGIVGAGAIGGYYGALLARAGYDVHFLVRSDLAAVREHGLSVKRPNDEFRLYPVRAHATAEEMGPCDLVVIALKATGNDALNRILPPLLHERTALLTLENGLGSDEFLADRFGAERVIGGLCFICVNRTAPGAIWCMQPGSLSLAEFGRPVGDRLKELAAMFTRAGVKCSVSDDLADVRWKKLVWNVPFNGLSIAAGGITTDRILAQSDLEGEVRALMREIIDAAAKLGHAIPLSFIDRQIDATRPMGPYKPSSLIDFLARKEVEVEAIWGEPLRRAEAAGASMPRLRMLYALLRSLTSTARC